VGGIRYSHSRDGLHLTSEGYEVVFSMIKEMIKESLPDLLPTNMMSYMPDYSDFEGGDTDQLIVGCQQQYQSTAKGSVELA